MESGNLPGIALHDSAALFRIGMGCKSGLRVKSAADAEKIARRLILEKHPKAKRILFRKVDNMGYSWLIEGEVWFKRLGFFSVKRNFKLEISVESGEATSYQEERPKRLKTEGKH